MNTTELARGLGDLLEHELGVEEDGVVLDPLARGPEQVQGPSPGHIRIELPAQAIAGAGPAGGRSGLHGQDMRPGVT